MKSANARLGFIALGLGLLFANAAPAVEPRDETFDVGVDTRTPVDFSYDIPFRFNGKIDRLTFKLGPSQLATEDQKKVDEAIARARD